MQSSAKCVGTQFPRVPTPLHPCLPTEGECTASQMKTPICTHWTTTHQFIWQQKHTCAGLGGSPVEFGVVGHHYEIAHFQPRHRHTHPWNGPSKYIANQAQPPLHRCRMLPLLLAQMGHGLFCGFCVGRRRTSHRPCWTPMSNPPNSLWTARPDECAGWDNWMVALPLPKDPTAQAVDSDNSLNRRRGGLLTSWFTRWLQGFTLFFLFSKIKKTFIINTTAKANDTTDILQTFR